MACGHAACRLPCVFFLAFVGPVKTNHGAGVLQRLLDLCYVNDASKRSYFRMQRSHFNSHHMPIILLFLPLQRYKNSEGGPPCNSMPLVRLWLTICMVKCSYFLVRHCVCKITLLFCFGGSRQCLKVCEVQCVPRDPAITCPVLFKGSSSLLLLA